MSLIWPESPKPEGKCKDIFEIPEKCILLNEKEEKAFHGYSYAEYNMQKIIHEYFALIKNDKGFPYFLSPIQMFEKIDTIKEQKTVKLTGHRETRGIHSQSYHYQKSNKSRKFNLELKVFNFRSIIRDIGLSVTYSIQEINEQEKINKWFQVYNKAFSIREGRLEKPSFYQKYDKPTCRNRIEETKLTEFALEDQELIKALYYNIKLIQAENGASFNDFELEV